MQRIPIPLLLLVSGCSLTDPVFPPGTSRNDILYGPQATPAGKEKKGDNAHLWVSAVEYPEGYDWKRDTARGSVPCRLVLFKDGDRALELPVGSGISPDADMHRIVGGHLYTDGCTATETVIACDGAERFRYPGRESLRGFLIDGDGSVHTLGQNRDGPGFSYRIDGESVYEQPTGNLFGSPGCGTLRGGALYRDGASLCFAFVTGGGHALLWKDGKEEELFLDEPSHIFDIRSVGGRAVAVYVNRESGLRLSCDGTDYCPASLMAVSARILPDRTGGFLVAVRYRNRDGQEIDALVDESGLLTNDTIPGGRVEWIPGMDENSSIRLDGNGKVTVISWKGKADPPETGRWTLMGPTCIWMDEKEAWVALTGQPPECPALWHQGEMTTLLMNGYLTGVVYE